MKKITKKCKKALQIEKEQGECIEELLRKKYVDEHKSIKQIANELGLSYVTIFRYLDKAGIYSRKLSSLQGEGF